MMDRRNRPPACQRTSDGRLRLTSRCAMLLALVGLVTGFLSGMFGVGGGFVIVPALVLFSGMPIHRAVATSLLVIVLVSISGVLSHVVAGRDISLPLTSLFVVGGVFGLTLGGRAAKRLSGPDAAKSLRSRHHRRGRVCRGSHAGLTPRRLGLGKLGHLEIVLVDVVGA